MADVAKARGVDATTAAVVEQHRTIHELADRIAHARSLVELLHQLKEFRALLATHFLAEESPGGFFDVVRGRAARHAAAVERLQREHGSFLGDIDRLADAARACLAGPVAELLQEARALAGRQREHEDRENALLIDAMYTDGGQGD